MGVIDYIRINSNSLIIVHREKRHGNTFIDLFFLVVVVLHVCSQLRTDLLPKQDYTRDVVEGKLRYLPAVSFFGLFCLAEFSTFL